MNLKKFLTQLRVSKTFSDNELEATRITTNSNKGHVLVYLMWLFAIAGVLGAVLGFWISDVHYQDIISPSEVMGAIIPGSTPEELGIHMNSVWIGTSVILVINLAVMVETYMMVSILTESRLTALRSMIQLGMIPIYLIMFILMFGIGQLCYAIFSRMNIIGTIVMLIAIEVLRQSVLIPVFIHGRN